jgi:hypothetical protein
LFTLTPPALSTLSTPIILYTPTPTPTGGILAGLRSSLNWVLVICGILVLALVILIIVLVSRRKTGQTPPAEGIPPAGPLP